MRQENTRHDTFHFNHTPLSHSTMLTKISQTIRLCQVSALLKSLIRWQLFYVLQIIQSASCSMTIMNKKCVHSILRIIHPMNNRINELPLPRFTIHRSIYNHLVVRLLFLSMNRHLMGPSQMTYA